MMPQSIHALKQAFQKVPSFTKKEFYDFLLQANQTLSEAELLWCIYELKNKNIIQKNRNRCLPMGDS
jgi:tRNA U54 and U55 pseudouridine synthase Pus10